jgi:rare lipoprotein A
LINNSALCGFFLKLRLQILVFLLLLVFGCSTNRGTVVTEPSGPVPPLPESKEKTRLPSKTPATQKPYTIDGIEYTPIARADGFVQTGVASWYGDKFHGRKTSNGEVYNMFDMTAAHKTLPMNTWVSVQNLENDRKIVVRINDRGPFVTGRVIDLSYTGAKEIGIADPGTAKVKVTALGEATSYSAETKKPDAFRPLDYFSGNFTVQVGAFQVKANAEEYRDRLSKKYTNAHIVLYTDNRGTFYRVRVGKFTNLKDAERFGEKILSEGFGGTFAVAE